MKLMYKVRKRSNGSFSVISESSPSQYQKCPPNHLIEQEIWVLSKQQQMFFNGYGVLFKGHKLRRTNMPFSNLPSIFSNCSPQPSQSSNLTPRKSTFFISCSVSPMIKILIAQSFFDEFECRLHFFISIQFELVFFKIFITSLTPCKI